MKAITMMVEVIAMVVLSVSPTMAQTDYWWNNAGGGMFDDANNWDPADPPGPPGVPDTAIFELPEIYTVTFGQDHTNQRLLVNDGQVDFDLGSWMYSLEHGGSGADASVIIGQWSGFDPTLTLYGGQLSANDCTLAVLAGGSGSLTIDGSDTTWTNRGPFDIGAMGSGFATFQNGAEVNSYAEVFIGAQTDGTDSGVGYVDLWGQADLTTNWTIGDDSVYGSNLYVGDYGQGTINIYEYATLTMKEHVVDGQGNRSSGWVILGTHTGVTGNVNVQGPAAHFNVEHSPVIVGGEGEGTLKLLDGGQMWMGEGELFVASDPGSTGSVEVSGPDSTLEQNHPMGYPSVVGVKGNGTLTIEEYGSASFTNLIVGQVDQSIGHVHMASSGTLASGYTCLGDQAGSYGEAYIDQDALWTVSDKMNVGREGQGYMEIWGGGKLDQTFGVGDTFTLVLGSNAGSEGTVLVEGYDSRLDTAGELVIGGAGTGTMNVTSGAQVTASQSHLATVAGSEGWLTVHGEGASFHTNTGGLLVGREGEGHLLVEETATMTLGGRLDVGEQPGGKGWANVESGGIIECDGVVLGRWGPQGSSPAAEGYLTLWGPEARLFSNSQILVGRDGYGELNVGDTAGLVTQKGSSESGTSGVLGASEGSTGLATVNNASWSQDGGLVVGWSGTGTLNIEDWGTVESQAGAIGRMSSGIGAVTVAGDHAVWNIAEDLAIGGSMDAAGGTGSLTVTGGEGHVRVGHTAGGTLRVWDGGQVSVEDGRMVVGSDVLSETGALWIAPLGVLDLQGGLVSMDNMYVDGQLIGQGEIIGDVHVGNPSDPGILAPGHSAGTITLTGNLQLDGLAQFDIMGYYPGEYDLVQSTYAGPFAVSFGGTLALDFIGSYNYGDEWLIFDFENYQDDFASVVWTGLPASLAAQFDPTAGIVRITPEPATLGLLVLGSLALLRRGRK